MTSERNIDRAPPLGEAEIRRTVADNLPALIPVGPSEIAVVLIYLAQALDALEAPPEVASQKLVPD